MISLVSVNETMKPINPVKISTTRKPKSDTSNISSFEMFVNSVVKIKIAAASLVPIPANVTGMKPTMFAIGNKRIK